MNRLKSRLHLNSELSFSPFESRPCAWKGSVQGSIVASASKEKRAVGDYWGGTSRKMKGSLAKELYAESLRSSKLELDTTTANSHDEGEDDDGSLWNGSDEEFDKACDLDREWQKRRDQFHTIGYRDGLLAGKEASAQGGFNIGFKESFAAGYNWGLVRGVTSVLACIPDNLKERLVETQEDRNKFKSLYESVHSLSTTDALKLFHEDIVIKKEVEHSEHVEASSNATGLQEQSSDRIYLENHVQELQSLLLENPTIQAHFELER